MFLFKIVTLNLTEWLRPSIIYPIKTKKLIDIMSSISVIFFKIIIYYLIQCSFIVDYNMVDSFIRFIEL